MRSENLYIFTVVTAAPGGRMRGPDHPHRHAGANYVAFGSRLCKNARDWRADCVRRDRRRGFGGSTRRNFESRALCAPDGVLGSSAWADLGVPRRASRPHGGHQSANAQNLQDALHVVGQHVQRHFAPTFGNLLILEVRGSHPRLDGPKRMRHGLVAHAIGAPIARVFTQPGPVPVIPPAPARQFE
jgi:hypothetical protein